ncbi:glycine-N-acyltransferase-like protein 3 [Platichthys flesus]|uniref:glycine-N-acyltransferase-like protein 3 n=1 Tax=Platichthys flesus TaxID=8260 RepID=UPI001A8250F6|nr:glycine-N-acyltransferase-like protein 3 [Platichthys flesus]
MKVLDKDELKVAEGVLFKHLPKSYKVYGFLYGINRNKPSTLEVVVDSWPDFKVIICRPDPKVKLALQLRKKVSCFSTDAQVLKELFTEENVLDWSTDFTVGGLNKSNEPTLMEVSSIRQISIRPFALVHLLYLADSSHLLTPTVSSELESRISSLNLSHVDLVNKTWKFGGTKQGYNMIEYYIGNFPTCCITDRQGRPVCWILVYDYCAMGMLYTLPEHRGKGYAKILVSTMARRLHDGGHPVYCFIEEESVVSYRLFKNLGFTEDPSYRAQWFDINV